MATKAHTPEQIITKLREAEVLLAQGQTQPAVCKALGITVHTYYRWRKEYGGMKVDQAKHLRELDVLRLSERRVWRAEGLKVPIRQHKRRRLWLGDGSCVRLRPERANHVWSYDLTCTRYYGQFDLVSYNIN